MFLQNQNRKIIFKNNLSKQVICFLSLKITCQTFLFLFFLLKTNFKNKH